MGDELIEPAINIFVKEGVLGAIILVQMLVIGYLFRRIMQLQDQRVTDIKEEAEKHAATTLENARVIASNTTTLESVRIAIMQAPTREKVR